MMLVLDYEGGANQKSTIFVTAEAREGGLMVIQWHPSTWKHVGAMYR